MASVDNLSVLVDLLIVLAVTVFYTGVMVWLNYHNKDLDRAEKSLREGAWIIGLIGGLIGLFAIWAELTFPLTEGTSTVYNVFFFDPLVMLSLLTVGFAVAVALRFPTHYIGVLGVVMGSAVVYYGIHGYELGLTKAPLETLLMYLAFGGLAMILYIPTLFLDWFVVGPKVPSVQPVASSPTPANPRMWAVLLGFFLAVTFLAGLAAVLYGFSIVWSHV
jgi:putative membrane protein